MFELSHEVTPLKGRPSSQFVPRAKRRYLVPRRIVAYAEIDGVGLGRLCDGSAYLSQRGLARLCGVQNAHIGSISRDWQTTKPRILAIKARLREAVASDHSELKWAGRLQYCYTIPVCEAILDYYALDAGEHIQEEAQSNRIRFKREDLSDYILRQVAAREVENQAKTEFRSENPDPISPDTLQQPPLRFVPTQTSETRGAPQLQEEFMSAFIIYVCGLCALSVWMAHTYLEGLKQRALNASWNRLGLYLPLKAVLEIQAEAVLLMKETLTVK